MSGPFAKDPRPASAFTRYHRRTRRRTPHVQLLAIVLLAPLLGLLWRVSVRGREYLIGPLCRVQITGREHLPDGGYIAAANHPSILDPVFVAVALRRRIRFMGKSDLFAGMRGCWLSRLGVFPVRRGVWDDEAFTTARAVLDRGKVMAMFPEGGVSPQDGYRAARPGIGQIAHLAGATVVPIHLDGPRRLYRPWSWPVVRVTIGAPLVFEQDPQPCRDGNQAAAGMILDAIIELAPAGDGEPRSS